MWSEHDAASNHHDMTSSSEMQVIQLAVNVGPTPLLDIGDTEGERR